MLIKKMFRRKLSWLILLLLAYIPSAWASGPIPNLGDVSNNILEPGHYLVQAIYNICIAIGVALILGGLMRYRRYRQNPMEAPLSQVLALLFFGITLVVLPVIAKLSEGSAF
ncbi:MAG: hypothetical protein Tsb005_06210 [Gammaproteobacteria bacterium]